MSDLIEVGGEQFYHGAWMAPGWMEDKTPVTFSLAVPEMVMTVIAFDEDGVLRQTSFDTVDDGGVTATMHKALRVIESNRAMFLAATDTPEQLAEVASVMAELPEWRRLTREEQIELSGRQIKPVRMN